ncbi:amino acid ABC transporter permease [Paracoccus seriniphilus]|uniref:Amino acid ABC transporter membrane protein 1, PAAT family n=1 Tax=Paracoccus seriniphilus TaxID=184748 RepID=A0A239PUF2_9RHOB|nr:amino acid ABC transporter permease [Paracoccus seriniphilus]WCR15433.1 amino acid ABC transporter permease [Paracoccus seriniphilus]SNT73924.1 amino acid ABC transporter membrane protein 1, PAAT family [Paracoccus seriniphilus]
MAEILGKILSGLPWTIALTLLSLLAGMLLGVPMMMARVSRMAWLRFLSASVITFIRSIPPIVWLFVIFFGVGSGYLRIDPFPAAVIGMGLISSAYMAEIYRGALLSIHAGQWEGAAALGVSRTRIWTQIILPQLFRVALPAIATFAIGLLKDSAIASTIGVKEMTFVANQQAMATYRGLEVFSMVALAYIVISLPVAWATRELSSRMQKKVSR